MGSSGARVTVRGTGFASTRKVMFGAVAGVSVKVISPEELKVTVPALALGTVNLRVLTAVGASSITREVRYKVAPTAVATALVVSSVSPQVGPPSGGTPVTVTGTGFTKVTKVAFGAVVDTSVSVYPRVSCKSPPPRSRKRGSATAVQSA